MINVSNYKDVTIKPQWRSHLLSYFKNLSVNWSSQVSNHDLLHERLMFNQLIQPSGGLNTVYNVVIRTDRLLCSVYNHERWLAMRCGHQGWSLPKFIYVSKVIFIPRCLCVHLFTLLQQHLTEMSMDFLSLSEKSENIKITLN
jgi:hypothetical protein